MKRFPYHIETWHPVRSSRSSYYDDIRGQLNKAALVLLYEAFHIGDDVLYWSKFYIEYLISNKPGRVFHSSGFIFKPHAVDVRSIYFDEDYIAENAANIKQFGLKFLVPDYPISHIEFGEIDYLDEDNDLMSVIGIKVFYMYH